MATFGQYNPEELTAQEVVDIAAEHLLQQGGQSVNEKETCCYQGPYDTCCAAAPFVCVDYNKGRIEGNTYDLLVSNYGQPKEHMEVIQGLQEIHDEYDTFPSNLQVDWVEYLEAKFLTFTTKHGLKMPNIFEQYTNQEG